MWLIVRMVLLSWRFKGTTILSLKINIAFLLLYGIKKSKLRGKSNVCMSCIHVYVKLCIADRWNTL
jgi:hypothetical protein